MNDVIAEFLEEEISEPYEIQPLRLLGGWTVEFNNFCECEPDNCRNFGEIFVEDLLRLTNIKFNLILDLGWYPDGDRNGAYELCLVKDYKWEKPLEVFESRDTKEIVAKIEYWTNHGFYQKYLGTC
ncbi:hypothetical protein [Desulfosporosinus hippei]|uniref:Uncharacterized protein n=1 Tax=Desulfosporosinus hippei DSM 8344 TaxID=1121419 RepID=A0A1G8C544_9FIRM|nr:hypothetical protein [Desulfosporosinus hippei]SDH40512.1 hypothetical protein SAMN05443529_1135 [Desulfosporosinus hippei DSM 8344]